MEPQKNPLQQTRDNIQSPTTYLICSENSPVQLLCSNYECKKSALMCEDRQCHCHSQHQDCLKTDIESVTMTLEDKMVTYQTVKSIIKQKVTAIIQQLKRTEEQLTSHCNKTLDHLVGLKINQKKILRFLKQSNPIKVTGQDIYEALTYLQRPQKFNKMLKILQSDVQKLWNQFNSQIKKVSDQTKQKLNFFGLNLFRGSKLIKKNQQQQNLIVSLFENQSQRLVSAKLLFRASRDGFSAEKFHSSCNDQSNTLIICLNNYGKTLGGFSILPWQSSQRYSYYNQRPKTRQDNSGKSFIFSLDDFFKFNNISNKTSIGCNSDYGPIFGQNDGSDFIIADNSQQNSNSRFSPNICYKNQKFTKTYKNQYTQITGSKDGTFKVSDYQVWTLGLKNI